MNRSKLKRKTDNCQDTYYKALNNFRKALISEQNALGAEVARLDNLESISPEQQNRHDELTSRLVSIFVQLESLYY